jgi:phosphonate metabolism protein PhnN/1,5-bisphosphokinase (PRPP-forming)
MLVGVVGPSGAGKDTLLSGARAALVGNSQIRWVRRVITRPAEAGGEDHLPVDSAGFAARRQAGGFALWWEAHGLLYGIPRDIEADLAAGRLAVANLSRSVLAEAADRYPLVVLEITAPPALRAERLAARGREAPADIAARLAREAPLPDHLPVARVVNEGSVEQGVARIIGLLQGLVLSRAIRPRGC